MKQTPTQQLILSGLVVCLIVMMAFVGISAYTEGDVQPVLLLFVGVVTPMVTAIVGLIKSDRTLKVSHDTDKKVDELLNGSLQGKISSLDERVGQIETHLVKILSKLS